MKIVAAGMLLTAAKMLKEKENLLAGRVRLMFQPAEETFEGAKDMMGTVGIVGEMSKGIRAGFEMVLNYIILFSFNLGIMNLLPLPALDGGRLVFLAFEGIFRKPVPRGKEAVVHLVGMALLLILMVVLTYQDIARLITGG